MTKVKKITIIMSLLCLLLIGVYIYKHFVQVQNVFDQMYYNRVQSGITEYFISSAFDVMPQIDGPREWGSTIPYEGVYKNNYKDKYLSEGEDILIVCSSGEKAMTISAIKRFDDFKLIYRYTYDVKNKQLTEVVRCRYGELYSGESNEYLEDFKEYTDDLEEIVLIVEEAGLTKADLLQYKKYFLYDKLLTDWLEVKFSRFSINRWGRVEYIEVLPLESAGE